MLVIAYDPVNGIPATDGAAATLALNLVEQHKVKGAGYFKTASYIVVQNIRLLVATGKIPAEEVIFKFDGYDDITIRPTGQLSAWPNGFCDHDMKLLSQLLKARAGK